MIARVRVLVHCRERVRGHGAPGAAEPAGTVVVMGLQRRCVAVVLRGAVVVLVDRGRGGRREVWMGVRVRVVNAAHVVRVLLELDERRLGRGHWRYAAAASAARVLATDGRVVAARAVGATGTAAATAGTRSACAQSRCVHSVATGHRRRRARGPLLLLLVSASTAAPSERAPDLPVIQRDGCRVQRPGGEINFDRRRTCFRSGRARVSGAAVCRYNDMTMYPLYAKSEWFVFHSRARRKDSTEKPRNGYTNALAHTRRTRSE